MYNHNKAQQSKNRVHISWDILYSLMRFTGINWWKAASNLLKVIMSKPDINNWFLILLEGVVGEENESRWMKKWTDRYRAAFFVNGSWCKHYCALIPAWKSKSNHIHYKEQDEITYPFPNFNHEAIEVGKWISSFTPPITWYVITCWD